MQDTKKGIDVKGSPSRCPYCHDDVAPDSEGASVCRDCLARHHGACWDSHGACATCAGATRLEAGAPPRLNPATARQVLLRGGLSPQMVDAIAFLAAEGPAAPRAPSRTGPGLLVAKLTVGIAFAIASEVLTSTLGRVLGLGSQASTMLAISVGLLVFAVVGVVLLLTRDRS